MGPEAAVNAVYFNVIESLEEPERSAFIEEKRTEYNEDVDLYRLASEDVVDAVIEPVDLRSELIRRYAIARPLILRS